MSSYRIVITLSCLVVTLLLPNVSFAETISDDDGQNCIVLKNNFSLGTRDTKVNGEVSILQDFLKEQGYYKGSITGYYGSLTKSAVKAFQKKKYANVTEDKIDTTIVPSISIRKQLVSSYSGPNAGFVFTGTGNLGKYTRAKIAYVSCIEEVGNTSQAHNRYDFSSTSSFNNFMANSSSNTAVSTTNNTTVTQTGTTNPAVSNASVATNSTSGVLPLIPTFSFDRVSIPPKEFTTLSYHFWASDREVERKMLCNVQVYDVDKKETHAWGSLGGAQESSKIFRAIDYPKGANVEVVCFTQAGEVRKNATFSVAPEKLETYSYATNNGGGSYTGVSKDLAIQMCDKDFSEKKSLYIVCKWGGVGIKTAGDLSSINFPTSYLVDASISANGIDVPNDGTINIPPNSKIPFIWNSNGGTSCFLNKNKAESSGVISIGADTVGNHEFVCSGMNSFKFKITSQSTLVTPSVNVTNQTSGQLTNASISVNGVGISDGAVIAVPSNSEIPFSWNSNGGTSCRLNKDAAASSGSFNIGPNSIGEFTFACLGMNSFKFNIVTAGSPSAYSHPVFSVDKTVVTAGTPVTFTWSAPGGSDCQVERAGQPIGQAPSSPTVVDTTELASPTPYSMAVACHYKDGQKRISNQVSVTVNSKTVPAVQSPVLVNASIYASGVLISNPGRITVPSNSEMPFSWNSNGGTSCTLNGNAAASSGSFNIGPNSVGEFTFACSGMVPFRFDVVLSSGH